jgi:hypothetical protein
MFRQAKRFISTVTWRNNHYANEPAMRATIEAKVFEFAEKEGLDDRGADEATVKYYFRILQISLIATEVLSIIIPATRPRQNGLPSNSGINMAILSLLNMSKCSNEEKDLVCVSTVRLTCGFVQNLETSLALFHKGVHYYY